ncbi:MAG: HAMP domain-containing sensor histidine kinase [Sulfuricurvum sp.]|nr:HAMP domain-containing sensor histidine kinase [Sulfuricurvum sp.]
MQNVGMFSAVKCQDGCDEVAFLSRKILDLNKKLIESEKAKSRFLSLVANALNNPMTALLGMIPHLAPQEGGERRQIYDLIEEEALILDFRIQNLVAAAEIESGINDLSHALVDVASLVHEALESLKYPIRAKNMDVRLDDNLGRNIVSDPRKLYLILKNLLANACCYGEAGTPIDVTLSAQAERVEVTVTNRGEGPDVEYKPQVFTRFAQGPGGAHGLGIGLSIVRDYSERMGGSTDYSVREGAVTFRVDLPLQMTLPDSEACGSNEFFFESFDDAIEI